MAEREPLPAILKVSAVSPPEKVAAAIVKGIEQRGRIEVDAMGAQAVYQLIRAVCIARDLVAAEGLDFTSWPRFQQVVDDGLPKSVIRVLLERR